MGIIPFSNSIDYICWLGQNCDKCEKYYVLDEEGNSTCEIENAIALSRSGEELDEPMVLRMGGVYQEEGYNFFKMRCTEFQHVQHWYVVGTGEGDKTLILGPYQDETKATSEMDRVNHILTCLSVRDIKVSLDELTLSIEQLPIEMKGQLNIVMEKFGVQ